MSVFASLTALARDEIVCIPGLSDGLPRVMINRICAALALSLVIIGAPGTLSAQPVSPAEVRAIGVLEPPQPFRRFVSALKIPFPGNGDFGSKRRGSIPKEQSKLQKRGRRIAIHMARRLFGGWMRFSMLRGKAVCRASLILRLTDFIHTQHELF